VSTDPGVWRQSLCRLLAGRELTDAEKASLPALPDGPLCAGA